MSKFSYHGQNRKACIDPGIGRQVYDYYNGLLEADQVRAFERHLVQCKRCESTVLELDAILSAVNDQQDLGTLIETHNPARIPFASWLNRRSKH